MEHLFKCLSAICVSSLVKSLLRSLAYFQLAGALCWLRTKAGLDGWNILVGGGQGESREAESGKGSQAEAELLSQQGEDGLGACSQGRGSGAGAPRGLAHRNGQALCISIPPPCPVINIYQTSLERGPQQGTVWPLLPTLNVTTPLPHCGWGSGWGKGRGEEILASPEAS